MIRSISFARLFSSTRIAYYLDLLYRFQMPNPGRSLPHDYDCEPLLRISLLLFSQIGISDHIGICSIIAFTGMGTQLHIQLHWCFRR